MGKHLELAQQFIREQQQHRTDLMGAILVGSSARHEETAFSDVDLRLIVQAEPDNALDRNGVDVWRDGIYIDALPVPWNEYTDVEQVLTDPICANDLNSGLILYDPTGNLVKIQHEVQKRFMAPVYVAQRVQASSSRIAPWLHGLQQAITSNDMLNLCFYTGRLVFGLALIPLIQQGISPSSTRHLRQVGQLTPKLHEQLCELESSTQMELASLLKCHKIFTQLSYAHATKQWGHLPEYVVKKTEWMVHNGYPREALHAMWINSGFRAKDCLQSQNSSTIETAKRLVEAWLELVGWTDMKIYEAKWQQITSIWIEIQTITPPGLSSL